MAGRYPLTDAPPGVEGCEQWSIYWKCGGFKAPSSVALEVALALAHSAGDLAGRRVQAVQALSTAQPFSQGILHCEEGRHAARGAPMQAHLWQGLRHRA